MGTAHVLLHKYFFKSLHNYSDQVRVVESMPFDDEDFFNVLVESDELPEGYNGQQEMFVKQGKIQFKREADV